MDDPNYAKERIEDSPPPGLMPDGELNVVDENEDDIWEDEEEDGE